MSARPLRLVDRAAATADRLAADAFDCRGADVCAWLDDAILGNCTDRAQELARDVLFAAAAFCTDSDHLTDLKCNYEALRQEYVDTRAGNYLDEAWQIEVEEDECAKEAAAEAIAEMRAEEAREAALRG